MQQGKFLPIAEDIEKIRGELLPLGFREMQGLDHFRETMHGKRAIPPKPRKGAETGFIYNPKSQPDLSAIAWITWLEAEGEVRTFDSGWVLIAARGRGVYFIPVSRTKNFTYRLTMEARIARRRVLTRPRCVICGCRMLVKMGKGRGSRFWECPRSDHRRCSRAPWDTKEFLSGLPAEAGEYLEKRRKRRARWQAELRKKGKEIRTAALRRRKWKVVG